MLGAVFDGQQGPFGVRGLEDANTDTLVDHDVALAHSGPWLSPDELPSAHVVARRVEPWSPEASSGQTGTTLAS